MFIKITLYRASKNRIVFFDSADTRSMWESYFLSEIGAHMIIGFTIEGSIDQ